MSHRQQSAAQARGQGSPRRVTEEPKETKGSEHRSARAAAEQKASRCAKPTWACIVIALMANQAVADPRACSEWADQGECERNPAFMTTNCAAWCADISHQSRACSEWANQGECERNPAFMATHCAAWCATEGCAAWVSVGECARNPAFMSKMCARSCAMLALGEEAELKPAYDDVHSTSGAEVEPEPAHEDANAEAERTPTGGDVPLKPPGESAPQPADPSSASQSLESGDARCSTWAAHGECARNQVYMLKTCAEACAQMEDLAFADEEPHCATWPSTGGCVVQASSPLERAGESIQPMPTRRSAFLWERASSPGGRLLALRRRFERSPISTAVCILAGLAIAWVARRRSSFDGDDGKDKQRRQQAVTARLQCFPSATLSPSQPPFASPSQPPPSSPSPPPQKAPTRARRRWSPLRPAPSACAFDDPPRHQPVPAAMAGDAPLQVHGEEVTVHDGGYAPQRARAVLDTGNAHMTVIDEAFARRHSIYSSSFAPVGYTTLRGINAETRAPVVLAVVTLRSREFRIRAAVSPLARMDVLVGMDILEALFAEGLALGQKIGSLPS